MMKPPPCKDCGRHSARCHVECTEYRAWKLRSAAEKAALRESLARASDGAGRLNFDPSKERRYNGRRRKDRP